MEQLTCKECDEPLKADDRFCGVCGTPSGPAATGGHSQENGAAGSATNGTPPDAATNGAAADAAERVRAAEPEPEHPARPRPATATAGQQPFFTHAPAARRPEWMTNDTRYLCAAPYLNFWWAYVVVRTLLGTRRAVVPSVGFDLGAVIRHCLRARKMVLARDSVLLLIVLIGLVKLTVPTFDFLLISFLLGWLLPAAKWRSRNWIGKIIIAISAFAVVGAVGAVTFTLLAAEALATLLSSTSPVSALAAEIRLVAEFAGLFVLSFLTEFAYRHAVLSTLTEDLRQGAPPPQAGQGRAERRIAEVEAAQFGNLSLYGLENPFIGTGKEIDRHWSIAIELNRAQRGGLLEGGRRASRVYVPIDPVELHAYIRARLTGMKDQKLPPAERLAALSVEDHVVGSGLLPKTSPLVDQATMTPYSQVSQEAIEALIRHPQAGLRYYQRASVIDWGPPVTSDGRMIIQDADQGIAVSAFIYAAVEGRMFYLQFVRTALPPVAGWYRSIDLRAGGSGKSRAAAAEAVRETFRSVVRSPGGIWAAFGMMRVERRANARTQHVNDSSHADLGARVSVREFGAADDYGTHIRELDVDKYTVVFERMLLDTVLDFLEAKGVDVSAFQASADTIINVQGNNNQIGSNQRMTTTAS